MSVDTSDTPAAATPGVPPSPRRKLARAASARSLTTPTRGKVTSEGVASRKQAQRRKTVSVTRPARRSSDAGTDQVGSIEVMLRIRPLSAEEQAAGDTRSVVIDECVAAQLMQHVQFPRTHKHVRCVLVLVWRHGVTNRANPNKIKLRAPTGSAAKSSGNAADEVEFDKVLGEDTTQEQCFSQTAAAMVDQLPAGVSSVLFTYGVTNSGKSHTILGKAGAEGVLPRTLERLFQLRDATPSGAASSQGAGGAGAGAGAAAGAFTVRMSVLEVHNESLKDLLAAPVKPGRRQPTLRLREHIASRSVQVENLSGHDVASLAQARGLVDKALRRRRTSDTNMNADSSRGHAVFLISIMRPNAPPPAAPTPRGSRRSVPATPPRRRSVNNDAARAAPAAGFVEGAMPTGAALGEGLGCGEGKIATFCLVDMAGIERLNKSGVTGSRLKETCHINQSLRVVTRVFQQLKLKQENPRASRVIP